MLKGKDLLSIHDLTSDEVMEILNLAHELKAKQKAGIELSSPEGHKGLISIQDHISSLGGTVSVCSCVPSGFEIRIELPMKGENSYEHFTGRRPHSLCCQPFGCPGGIR